MKTNRAVLWLFVALVAATFWLQRDDMAIPAAAEGQGVPAGVQEPSAHWPAFLPSEARPVLRRIASGEPHPHRQDGTVFQNREGRLPAQPRGFYREYTVETPGLGHRGARRIVTGGEPPSVYYYTDDHYDSFRRFEPPSGLRP